MASCSGHDCCRANAFLILSAAATLGAKRLVSFFFSAGVSEDTGYDDELQRVKRQRSIRRCQLSIDSVAATRAGGCRGSSCVDRGRGPCATSFFWFARSSPRPASSSSSCCSSTTTSTACVASGVGSHSHAAPRTADLKGVLDRIKPIPHSFELYYKRKNRPRDMGIGAYCR